jgi:hypothetical protein
MCIGAGIVLTVLNAWRHSTFDRSPTRVTATTPPPVGERAGAILVPDGYEWRTWITSEGEHFRRDEVTEMEYIGSSLIKSGATGRSIVRVRSGWPMFAMQRTDPLDAQFSGMSGPIARAWTFGWSPDRTAFLRLPLRPIPIGFAVNTLFWSAVCAAPILVARHARRVHRRTRGQCAGCAYDVRGLDRCPECGERCAALPLPLPTHGD